MTTIPDRVSRLEGTYEQVDRRLGDLTESVTGLREEVRKLDTKLDTKIDGLRGEVGGLRREIDAKINVLILVTGTVGVAMAGAMIAFAFRV